LPSNLGFFDIREESLDGPTGCKLEHDFYYTYENSTLDFKLIMKKDTRTKIVNFRINVTQVKERSRVPVTHLGEAMT